MLFLDLSTTLIYAVVQCLCLGGLLIGLWWWDYRPSLPGARAEPAANTPSSGFAGGVTGGAAATSGLNTALGTGLGTGPVTGMGAASPHSAREMVSRDPAQPALAVWGAGYIGVGIAITLLLARGSVADWVSIGFANALLAAACALFWNAARLFDGRRPLWPLASIGAVVWILACLCPGFYENQLYRVLLSVLTLAIYHLLTAWEFLRGPTGTALRSRPWLVATFLLLALTALARGFFAFGADLQHSAPLFTTAPQAWPIVVAYLFHVLVAACLAVLLIMHTKEKADQQARCRLATAYEAAANANLQKTRFLARLSHELRTPLNGVLSLTQTLGVDPDLSVAQRAQVNTLEHAGQRLLQRLNELLDLTRIETGRLELYPQPVVLRTLMEDLLSLLQGEARMKGLTLRQELDAALPDAILTDPLRLREILMSLLENAIRFTPPGGEILLQAAAEQPGPAGQNGMPANMPGGAPGVAPSGPTVLLAVHDTAPLIAEAHRAHLFDAYEQAITVIGPRNGLELAISARLAAAMGGGLSYEVRPGDLGNSLALRLPMQPAVAPQRRAAARPTPPLVSGLLILVVDDIVTNRLVLRAMLTRSGHTVEEAGDAAEALARLRQAPLPDVILMDEYMPGMDGGEATRIIRRMRGAVASIPILAITASNRPDEISAILASGADGHVPKPVDRDRLLATIARALDQRPPVPRSAMPGSGTA